MQAQCLENSDAGSSMSCNDWQLGRAADQLVTMPMLDWVLEGEDAALGLSLIAHVCILLAHAHHHT